MVDQIKSKIKKQKKWIDKTGIHVDGLSLWIGDAQILKSISLPFREKNITALIGPSGCGKSTLLRCFNRMNDLIEKIRIEGSVIIDNEEIHDPQLDVCALRSRVGMVFQKPNPFPKSIFENVAYGLRIKGIRNKQQIADKVEQSLIHAGLWGEVKDRLHNSAFSLSGGQQQRLCIARTLATDPTIILLDEPTSALDPQSTNIIEELLTQLKTDITIIIVTHNFGQAGRISDYTAFMYLGEIIEFNTTEKLFTIPQNQQTEKYLTGKFG